MADKKITELVETTSPSDNDIVPIVVDPSTVPTNKKVTVSNLISTKGIGDFGTNYQITSTVDAVNNNLTVSLKTFAGTDPSTTDKCIFCLGNEIIKVSTALSVTIKTSYGDVFLWDARKIQGNDAQLFVYIVSNNGTPQLGLAFVPNLTSVGLNYIDDNGQTGVISYKNFVMSGVRDEENLCRVIGRINVLQNDANTWDQPTIANIYNSPIFETDRMTWTPDLTLNVAKLPSYDFAYYTIKRKKLSFFFVATDTLTGTAGPFSIQLPILPANNYNFNASVYNGAAWIWCLAWTLYGYMNVYKAGASWTGNEAVQVYINGEYDI